MSSDESQSPEPDSKRLALRRLFEERLSQFPADSRTRLAGQLGDPELQALCFDPLPNVARALVENPRFGLVHARLLAAHHSHPTGLGALTKKDAFLRDTEVQRMLLRNVQTPPALLQRIFHQRRLIELFQLSVGREMPEKNKIASREALRARWNSGLSEEKVDTLFRTEGRLLAQLLGLAMDQKSAALFCHRTVTSLLLVQNLARWSGTPPSVLAHLLKQAVVRNQPQVKMLLLRHPNLPSHARDGD
ncbi:MAG TPA: hypothetical protein VMH40_08285 [Myxococcaceae bacterium]|nr:hypothetical protein [Myxococcaceae bacterium]